MRLSKVVIDHYRSIGHVEIRMPENKPLVLFGANNAGKSNIISAIQRALGERWPLTQELEDSDFFMRDKSSYPNATIACKFDSTYFVDRYGNLYDHFVLHYAADASQSQFTDLNGSKLYINNDARSVIQSFVVDADRDIGRELSYYSRYSLLSKFSHAVHQSLSEDDRISLEASFEEIKKTFEGVPEYATFFSKFKDVLEESVKGFVHSLKADFSAYDPNNFAKSIRIYAYEGDDVRAFEEFGTGEQQVLLMAFAKAYVETFGAKALVLIIEEPEAHLHPLAQRWLKEYVYEVCNEGLQVILSTHSADFLDMSNLDGMVRVTKSSEGITSARQVSPGELARHCHELGAPADKVTAENVSRFYGSKLFPDEAKGFFASKVLIVEGATEYFALPELFSKLGHSLVREGVEIVNVRGKTSIPLYWRLFSAFGIECCCIFDGDIKKEGGKAANDALGTILGIDVSAILDGMVGDGEMYVCGDAAFFSKDFERFMRAESASYLTYEKQWRDEYGVTSKPELARATSRALQVEDIPKEFETIWEKVITFSVELRQSESDDAQLENGDPIEDFEIPF